MRKTGLFLLLFFWGAVMVLYTEVQPNTGDKTSGGQYWYIIAQSTDIYSVDVSNFEKIITSNMELNRYNEINFPVMQTLKGSRCENISIRIYLRTETIDYLKSFYGSRLAILFVIKHYNRDTKTYANFLADNKIEDAFVFYDSGLADDIIEQAKFHQEILQKSLYANFSIDGALRDKVKRLIEDMTDAEKQLQAFKEMIELGEVATPYVILFLDNYKELPIKEIMVKIDSPDAWTGIAHYGPHLVVDLLGIVLPKITSFSFGFGHNGKDITNMERKHMIDCWRIYLYYWINRGEL